jgi:hypothetical protein
MRNIAPVRTTRIQSGSTSKSQRAIKTKIETMERDQRPIVAASHALPDEIRKHAIRNKQMITALMIATAVISFGISNANAAEDCSSPDTLEALNKIVDENAMQVIRNYAQPGNVEDKFINIITTDKTEFKTSCKFDIEMHFTGNKNQGKDFTKTWSETTGKQLHYTVEKTDDGRMIVTAYGLK